jgi:hypothetical protein
MGSVYLGSVYLLGGKHITALQVAEPSAANAVAYRFPEVTAPDAATARTLIASATTSHSDRNDELALLSPVPMMPLTAPQAAPAAVAQAPQADAQTPVQVASLDPAHVVPRQPSADIKAAAASVPPPPRAAAPRPASEAKAVSSAVHRASADRPGYMLNDSQIASIKARLNLTPDQEEMWPAVEAALRNMTYARTAQLRTRSLAPTQAADVDPDAVQGLKSAAVPLILSFSGEQKDEVRDIVHSMGLDQLASQF